MFKRHLKLPGNTDERRLQPMDAKLLDDKWMRNGLVNTEDREKYRKKGMKITATQILMH